MNKTLITAVCLIASALVGYMAIWPKYQDLRIERTNEAVKSADLANRKAYFADLAEIDAKLQEYESQLSIIDKAIPEEISTPDFFDLIQREVSQSGLVLKDLGTISSGPSSIYPNLVKNTLNISVSGPYNVFKNFISSLEKSARIIGIEKMSFSSPDRKDSPFTATLLINFYSLN